jgi:hypothetical protein
MMLRIAIVLLLAACTTDSGIIPSNRYIDRDIVGTRHGWASDVQDMRASELGFPLPSSRNTSAFGPN